MIYDKNYIDKSSVRIGICSLVIGLFLLGELNACAATQKQSTPQIMCLYSWQLAKDDYAFVLVRKSENERFLSQFNSGVSHIHGIANLELELAKLPPGSGVAWRDYKHIGLIFPPEHVRKQVEKAASLHHVVVEIVPTIYD